MSKSRHFGGFSKILVKKTNGSLISASDMFRKRKQFSTKRTTLLTRSLLTNSYKQQHSATKNYDNISLNSTNFSIDGSDRLWVFSSFHLRAASTAAGHLGQNSSAYVARSIAAIWPLLHFKWNQLYNWIIRIFVFVREREIVVENSKLILSRANQAKL